MWLTATFFFSNLEPLKTSSILPLESQVRLAQGRPFSSIYYRSKNQNRKVDATLTAFTLSFMNGDVFAFEVQRNILGLYFESIILEFV